MSATEARLLRNAIRAEWGKLWSLRSPALCLLGSSLVLIGTAVVLANDFVVGLSDARAGSPRTLAVSDVIVPALQTGLPLFLAFAMLTVTSEYAGSVAGSGVMGTTLIAEPRRGRILAAKAMVVAVPVATVGLVSALLAEALVRLLLSTHVAPGTRDTDLALRAATTLPLDAVLAVGLAALLRRSVGSLAAAVVLLLGSLALPSALQPWGPAGAQSRVLTGVSSPYPSWVGLLVLAGWAVGCYAVGLIALRSRDA